MAAPIETVERVIERVEDDSGDESDDEVVEQSPDGRWEKRREEVRQRDVPGIDKAFLSMDSEEGVEVVWNEVQFSERKNFKHQEESIRKVFVNLIRLDHPNIVKFHDFWIDGAQAEKASARVVFITEFMTSGSLKQFLKKTRINQMKSISEKVFKRWCRQILSALSYLHACDPPIIHGNLSCDTIFIQHNGLIKIGSVAPETIHAHVKTVTEPRRNMHCVAPEFGEHGSIIAPAVDIYSFGICALEMLALQWLQDKEGYINDTDVQNALESIENPIQRDFISKCLDKDPEKRITVNSLKVHACLFEVHSLKLQAAHVVVNNAIMVGESRKQGDPDKILASVTYKDAGCEKTWRESQVNTIELEKFLEEVKNGVYPLTCLKTERKHILPKQRPVTPETDDNEESSTPELETRFVISIHCSVKANENSEDRQLTLLLKMSNKMNRQLTCEVKKGEKAIDLADELVKFGFVSEDDKLRVASAMAVKLAAASAPVTFQTIDEASTK